MDKSERVAVTQADRDAAADYLRDNTEKGFMTGWIANVRNGTFPKGDHDLTLLFARHRANAIEQCAQVVDQCNREGPYNAIGAASRIRALST